MKVTGCQARLASGVTGLVRSDALAWPPALELCNRTCLQKECNSTLSLLCYKNMLCSNYLRTLSAVSLGAFRCLDTYSHPSGEDILSLTRKGKTKQEFLGMKTLPW